MYIFPMGRALVKIGHPTILQGNIQKNMNLIKVVLTSPDPSCITVIEIKAGGKVFTNLGSANRFSVRYRGDKFLKDNVEGTKINKDTDVTITLRSTKDDVLVAGCLYLTRA